MLGVMIVEKPFVTRREIVLAHRPGLGDSESAFRTLRSHGWVSDGVSLPLRSPAGGRLRGRVQLYASLNRDAARLARRGHGDQARTIAERAGLLESSAASRALVAAIDDVPAGEGDAAEGDLDAVLAHLVRSSGDLIAAFREIFGEVMAARRETPEIRAGNAWRYGRVERIDRDIALILDDREDERLMIPIADLETRALSTIGTAIAVHWERWGSGQTFIEAEPALDLSSSNVGADEPVFLNSTLVLDDDQQRFLDALLAGEGTITVPAAILAHRG
jgi:hypothetical protein